ncbi:hypothetical protein BDW02DRAFT_576844 [Decorospora gaudefroyi]|uniref:Uncharacterized protein n=1 Tax=Decorospora gaudefroyi TaxID=184978 RepID=A0A6A5KRX4_9PLEO|nr:hypothetical protein BDW02DRAFT_576844 [Decorospora gaudefroyi]
MRTALDRDFNNYKPLSQSAPKLRLAALQKRSRKGTEIPIAAMDEIHETKRVIKPELNLLKQYLAWLMTTTPLYVTSQFSRAHDLSDPEDVGAFLMLSTLVFGLLLLYQFLFRSGTEDTLLKPAPVQVTPGVSTPDYNPISPSAIAILRSLSTASAIYLVCLVLANLEILVLFPFVVKQRAYSYIYQELATPMVGPVFMTQMKQFGILMLDGFLAPWTWFGGAVGTRIGNLIR